MRKIRKFAAATTAAALTLAGCASAESGAKMGMCDKTHWGDSIEASVQSGPTPSKDSNSGGEIWEPTAKLYVEAMPGSPAASGKPLRLLIHNGPLPLDKSADHIYLPTEFMVQLDLENPDTLDAERVIASPAEFNLPESGTQDAVIYTVGESALKLSATFDPASDGGWENIGAQAPSGDFTLTCVKAE